MKERPILFSGPMVSAILDGSKTQTRRVIKPQPSMLTGMWYWVCKKLAAGYLHTDTEAMIRLMKPFCPYGQVGDQLWVRETHAIVPWTAYLRSDGVQQTRRPNDNHDAAIYKAGWNHCKPSRWRPSIHMPRWASRIQLEITGIRVERLQDISEADCFAEGCAGGHGSIPGYGYNATPYEHYKWLWESINGTASWGANPWVWVVEFKRIKP